jgi:hypothetical protein
MFRRFFVRRSNKVRHCVDEVASAPSAESLGIVCGSDAPSVETRSFEFPPVDKAQVLNAELILARARIQGLADANSKLEKKLADANSNLEKKLADADALIKVMETDTAVRLADAEARVETLAKEKAALVADAEARDRVCAAEKAALATELATRTAEMAALAADRARALENVRQLSDAQDLRNEARGLFGRVQNTFVVSRAELVRERNDFAKQLEVCRSALARKEWVLDQYDSEISSMRWVLGIHRNTEFDRLRDRCRSYRNDRR